MTLAEVLAFPPIVLNELVAERVMGWTRFALAQVSAGAVALGPGWRSIDRQEPLTILDGTTVDAPVYTLRTVLPEFISEEKMVIHAMALAGWELKFKRTGAGLYRCGFSNGAATPPTVELPSSGDAICRAAVVARSA